MKHVSFIRALFVSAFVATAVVSCGSNSADDTSSTAVESTTVDTVVGEVDDSGSPARIVSLSPTHTEILFAIGAGEQVVAVDAMSNHPAEAAAVVTSLSGYEPNVESIVSYEPDLVVIGDDYNGLAEQLASVGIDSWATPAPLNLDEVLAQIEDLGERVGKLDEASELATSMRTSIDEIVASTGTLDMPLSYYHELDDTYFTATSNTCVGSVYSLFGLRNIADAAEDQSDYPQLSAEFIISQNPDLVFLADTKCCAVSAESVAARPGWETLAAVQNGHVIALDDDIASRWGPRIVDFVRFISEAISQLVQS
ncbi:MAG: ABC transporter substrate-binding protein, partial [Actinomycetota bacterium]